MTSNCAVAPWAADWLCVGPARAVAEDGDHLTLDLPDRSVTIQNFRGAIAGFLNVCSHRAMQMRACGRGRGLLRCPYHGWVYNQNGVPVGIPDNDRLFQLSAADREALALPGIAVARRGALLFFRLRREGTPAADDLGGADISLVAERLATLDRPWTEILATWEVADEGALRRITVPNLILDSRDGWLLARYVVPVMATRSLVGAAFFHADETSLNALPDALARAWIAAPG